MKARFRVLITILLAAGLMSPNLALAAPNPLHNPQGNRQGEGEVRRDYHSETGKLSFIGVHPDSAITVEGAAAQGLNRAAATLETLAAYGSDFGLTNPSQEMRIIDTHTSRDARSTTRYQQFHDGVPILAGELIVNQDSQGRMLSINGEVSPGLSMSTEPELSIGAARDQGVMVVAKQYGLTQAELWTSTPELWIYDARLLKPSELPPVLVWRMDVVGVERSDIRELVLVDAQTGGIPLHFNQIDAAKDRDVYDNQNNLAFGLPGNGPVRTEGAGPTGIAEVDNAYDYSGDTYDFFSSKHGRDSLDDAGMTLVSTVRYCRSGSPCPFANAFWNGAQMVYGDGYASADDVVGHELTHGVTEFTSNLFYYYQSGAINESFSDIWGEFIDQTNGAGTDTAGVKWLMGEDAPGGAIRDMADPPAKGDPDRMGHANYYEASADLGVFGDNGGVHTNSGVNNKAAYLLTDGGSFNSQSVAALGIDKVAAIYYEVQTNLLTSGADYGDLYNALYQGCLNLVGGSEGITNGNCQEVRDATNAVEMDQEPAVEYNPEATICGVGETPVDLFFDDLESGSGNWTFGAESGSSSWVWSNGYSASGTNMLWGNDGFTSSDSFAAMNSDVALAGGSFPYLHFNHAFGFEDPDYDGAWLEYSTNSGGSWSDAEPFFTDGLEDYTGTINTTTGFGDNPHTGRSAFVGDSHGYVSSKFDLDSLAGGNVRFRFRMSTDSVFSDLGMVVDDVRIYTCEAQDELLNNGGMEVTVPSPWRGSNSLTTSDGSDCSVANTGSCSATLTSSAGGQTKMLSYGLPGFAGSAGDSFDLTYYNKRDSVGGAGAIQVRVTIRYTDATTQNFNYVPGVGTQDWQQYTESFAAAKDYNWGVVRLIFSKPNGQLWYDDMSLERNSTTELLSNGGMEVVVPSGWKASNSLTTSDGSDCSVANAGSCSSTLTASAGGQTKMLTYGLPGFGGSAGDEFTLTYFNKRNSVGGAGAIQVRVTLRYTDATTQNFNYVPGVGTQDWQEYTENFTAAKDYNWGVVRLIYSKPNGQLWYDDMSLLR